MAGSPYSVPVHDLIRRPGESREFALRATVPDGFGNAVIGVPAGTTLAVAGRLDSLHDGILVTAGVAGTASGECVRCLVPLETPVEVDFQELFAYAGEPDSDYLIQGDALDLEQVVRDTVVPALPFQPICQEDCEGLCPVCGVRLLDAPGHVHEAAADPRWEALRGLGSDEKASE